MNETNYCIDVHNLTKTFGDKKAVDNISIRVPYGKIYGFLGPNGSGKTTTIRLICGLLTPDEGIGTCLGYNVRTEFEKIRQHVGYMTQNFTFWEDLSIKENLDFVAEIFGLEHPKECVKIALENLNLVDHAHQLAGTLSGGWKQRLALAACVLHKPKLLLLDEPTAGVDPKARREFWDEIHRLAADGLTVLVSTHYMDEAERCHAIFYIANGKFITEGTVEEIIRYAGLTTWTVRGPKLIGLMREIENNPAVTTVAPFGESLHISGTDSQSLELALAPYRCKEGYLWTKVEPSLEDTFIHYMASINKGTEK